MNRSRLSALIAALFVTVTSAFTGGTAGGARLVHPNPFTEGCTFELNMPADGTVRIIVFDLLGRQVASLTDEIGNDYFPAGTHPIPWTGNDRHGDPVPAGTYVCVLYSASGEVINSVKVVKMAVIK